MFSGLRSDSMALSHMWLNLPRGHFQSDGGLRSQQQLHGDGSFSRFMVILVFDSQTDTKPRHIPHCMTMSCSNCLELTTENCSQ